MFVEYVYVRLPDDIYKGPWSSFLWKFFFAQFQFLVHSVTSEAVQDQPKKSQSQLTDTASRPSRHRAERNSQKSDAADTYISDWGVFP